jgi:hypothetical protein
VLETPKALGTIIFKLLLVIILKDNTMDNQQETKVIFIKLQVGSLETTRENRYNGMI